MSDIAPHTARDRLLEGAVALALAGGPSALTARALTASVGASPSAVNYHFGGRQGLLRAVHAAIAARQDAWRARRLAALPARPDVRAWPFVAGALVDQGAGARPERLALMEFAALRDDGDPELTAAARAEQDRQADFWRRCAAALGAGALEAEAWTAMAVAATPFVLLDGDAATALAWVGPAALRLDERLAGRATPGLIPWLAPGQPPGAASHPPGAQRLVDAALRVIAEQGLPAATLRAVAEAAGLSLGSTTYFFDSKAAIIHAAFVQLRDAASKAALEAGMQTGETPQGGLLTAGKAGPQVPRAILALTLAGARDSDLRPVAESLRSLTGQTTSQWLAVRRPGAYDRLDGFLGSLVSQGLPEAGGLWGPVMDRVFPAGA
jgi:AcrR family transcriptional regulator